MNDREIRVDGDSDYSDQTAQITTTAVDDVWSAGYVGLYRGPGGSSAQLFDDVTAFIDNDSDGILDAADDVQLSDDFASNVMTLTYDNNGNLTLDTALAAPRPRSRSDRRAWLGTLSQGLSDDGVLRNVYDAWNP